MVWNNCHNIQSYQSMRKGGPPLTHLEEKVNKEWVMKWIKDPQSFRYNTWMPHFFNQDNNSDDASITRNNTEIYAITEYLYPHGDKTKNNNSEEESFTIFLEGPEPPPAGVEDFMVFNI